MALPAGDNPNAKPMTQQQFLTLVVTILLIGAGLIAVNLTIERFLQVDRRFEQVEERLDRLEDRVDRMDRRIDEGFREMAAAIDRLEGLIQGLPGSARLAKEGPGPQDEKPESRAHGTQHPPA